MAIKWNDEKMATGLPEIDSQHKEWIRRFNEFDDAVVNGKTPPAQTYAPTSIVDASNYAKVMDPISAKNCSAGSKPMIPKNT